MTPRVLFISGDPVGREMAGLGIRYTELSRALAPHAEVTVAHGGTERGERLVPYAPHRPSALKPLIEAADVVVTPPQWPVVTRWLARSGARIVYDLYAPETLETLEVFRGSRLRRLMHHTTLDRLHDALATGHHFMCASDTQRALWLGAMLASRRIGPGAYDRDPTLREVIDVVPFGLSEVPPERIGPGPRERLRLPDEAEIVLWNGGIWNWFDAPTAIRAVEALAARRPNVRLVFMGAADKVAGRAAYDEARALAGEHVVFNDGWVPYAERGSWLLDADCAISTHRDHLEARFAFRTRVLDCLWAGLPIVCNSGDDLAERVAREDLGAVAPPADVDAVAAGIERVLERGRAAFAPQLAAAAAEHTWPRVAEPLIGWVTSQAPPPRPSAVPRSPGHAARAVVYGAGGRHLLARRGGD